MGGTHAGVLASPSLVTFFVIGLLGGAHCLGMCGPLVTTYADRMGSQSARERGRVRWYDVRQHALFNLGRTVSYAAVGAVMGALGAVVFDVADVLTVASGVRATAGVVTGAFIVFVGLSYVVRGTTGGHDVPLLGRVFGRVSGVLMAHVERWTRGPRIFGLGVVHAVLPCPILYPAFLYALAVGSPVEGALGLAAIGLGTFPTLFVYGTLFQSISTEHRVHLHRALGVAFVVLGYLPLSHGLGLLGIALPHPHVPFYQPL
ncbi:sulfite exporter TauE/SafE family protein [Haloarculaceae archaeon H-GB11]|nr:sulfite exporter TauE/SafE family protein [Haloarculaceae archaeon H-GB11]